MIDDFAFLGMGPRDWPTEFIGRFSGRLAIVAGASCVWDDLALLGLTGNVKGWDVLAVNDIFMHAPLKIRHLYSNDRAMIPNWIKARRQSYEKLYGPVEFTHTLRHGAAANWPWPGHGTSALGAVYTGIAMGYAPIVLCGVPLDDSPNYFSPPWEVRSFTREVGTSTDGTMQYWERAAKRCFKGRVKSMSGRTRELLGSP